MQYTNDMLRNLESAIGRSMEAARVRHESYIGSLQEFYDIISTNRAELNPTVEEFVPASESGEEDLPLINITSDMLN